MNTAKLTALIVIPTLSFSLTLKDMVIETVDTNPLVKIQKQRKNASQNRLRQEYAGYLPDLDVFGNAGVEKADTPSNSQNGKELNKYDSSVILKENIFQGFDTMNGVDAKKAALNSADSSVEESANSIALEAVKTYLNMLKAKELVAIAQSNLDVHKNILVKIEIKVKAGVQRQSMYDQTLSRLESSKSALLLEQQKYINAMVTFKRVSNLLFNPDDLQSIENEDAPYANKEEMLKIAMEKNPTVLVNMFDIEESKYDYQRLASKYYPKVDLQAEAKFKDNINGQEGINNSYAGLVVVSYNLYNGGEDMAQREENMHIMLERKERLADAKRIVIEQNMIAWNTFEYSKKQIVHLQKHIAAAGKTVQDYEKEYEVGRRSLVDLLNSQLELNSAKNKNTLAFYSQQQAYYEMLSYTGTLLETFEIVLEE